MNALPTLRRCLCCIAVAVGVVGCGGGVSIDGAVKQVSGAEKVDCTKAGLMVFVGERETVYDCTGSYASGASHSHCYVFVDGQATDVTDDLIDAPQEWVCANERREASDGVQRAQDALYAAQAAMTKAQAEARHARAVGAQPGSLEQRYADDLMRVARHNLAYTRADLSQAERALAETTGTSP
jgi:hypothetical protein